MKQPEAVKLFIGNVPRDWSEPELRKLLETYGDIHSLNVLKDKVTGQHKGCAFLSYYDKDAAATAQEELHEKKTLPGCRHPLQVKPADSETKVENRNLFLGMLSRSCDDDELKEMFSKFGTIENLTILKTSDGKSKGCGFIRFSARQEAQNAIREMHNSLTMQGCSKALVVKLADSENDKNAKRASRENPRDNFCPSNLNASPYNRSDNSSHTNSHSAMGLLGSGLGAAASSLYGGGGLASQLQQSSVSQQLLAQMGLAQQQHVSAAQPNLTSASNPFSASTNPLAPNPNLFSNAAPSTAGGGQQNTTMAALLALAAQQQQLLQLQQAQQNPTDSYANNYNSSAAPSQQQAAYTNLTSALGANLSNLQSQLGGGGGGGGVQGGGGGLAGLSALGSLGAYAGLSGGRGAAPSTSGIGDSLFQQAYSGAQQYSYPQNSGGFKQQGGGPTRGGGGAQQGGAQQGGQSARGPEGANLFIYHIPTEYNDNDLMRVFAPYGNCMSAKVFMDKVTGLSKSYGFVNYDSASSAQAAIRALDGFAIGSKRLKVELKKPREERSKPY